MNYLDHYNQLINRARNRVLDSHTESHHIVPKCMNGIDDESNLVDLTPEEHYTAHQLLVKIYPGSRELIHAAVMMTVEGKNHNRSKNKLYGWLRRKHSKSISIRQSGTGNSQSGRYWIYNLSTKEIKRITSIDVPDGWIRGKTPNSLCEVCGENTETKQRRFCDNHRPISIPPESKMAKGNNSAKKLSEYCKSRTKEQHPQFGKRWVNNLIVQKMVPKNKIDEFIDNGWIRGKIKRVSS